MVSSVVPDNIHAGDSVGKPPIEKMSSHLPAWTFGYRGSYTLSVTGCIEVSAVSKDDEKS